MAHNIRKYIVVKDPESDMAKEEKRRINRNTFLAQGRKKKLKIVRGELFSLFSFLRPLCLVLITYTNTHLRMYTHAHTRTHIHAHIRTRTGNRLRYIGWE